MGLVTGLILMCAIVSLGGIALVGLALWIRCNDDETEREDQNVLPTSL